MKCGHSCIYHFDGDCSYTRYYCFPSLAEPEFNEQPPPEWGRGGGLGGGGECEVYIISITERKRSGVSEV